MTTGTVTGTFHDMQGTPLGGKITFTPVPAFFLDSLDDVVFEGVGQSVTLDPSGHFSISLQATDDPALNPVNWTYEVLVELTGRSAREFYLSVPGGSTQDLADVTPIGTPCSGVLITQGPPGPVGPPGPATDVPPADGQLIAWSSTLGKFTPVNPVGQSQLALATNKTGVATTLPNTVVTLIPGMLINVPPSNGRPVSIDYGATFLQTATGTGMFGLLLYETTTSAVLLEISQKPLPNTTTTNVNRVTHQNTYDVGVVSSVRQFALYGLMRRDVGSADGSVMNYPSAPTRLRAMAG